MVRSGRGGRDGRERDVGRLRARPRPAPHCVGCLIPLRSVVVGGIEMRGRVDRYGASTISVSVSAEAQKRP